MGSNSVSIFGSNPYVQRTTKNIFGVGSTIEALTDDIIVELINVCAAATGNIAGVFNLGILTVPGAIVVDGVVLNLLDRVLLQQQTNPVENGVYQVLSNTGPSILARTVDFQPNIRSSKILVSKGDTLECTLWFNVKEPCLTLNYDPVKFIQDDGSGSGGGGGNVTGIPPTVIGNLSMWVDTTGTTIADSGLNAADILAALNQIINVTLTGTAYTSISTETNGSFVILVKNLVVDGPSAVFSITKNDPAALPSINTMASTPGTGTLEILELQWNPGMDIELRKNGPAHDGIYQITICGAGATGGGGGTGDITDGLNVGGQSEVFKQKTGSILEFRTLEAGTGIAIVENTDTITITNTGAVGANNRIAFNLAAIQILVYSPVLINVAYFAWDQSEYATLTDGRITLNAEIFDQEAIIQLFDLTAGIVISTITTAGTGVYTFPVTTPLADTRLILQVRNDGSGAISPELYGTTLSFEQN